METLLLLQIISAFFIIYLIGLYVYRLYFDPLAKFPGLKLAAASLWYEFYYDVIKKGQYTFEIAKMHKKYGKIVTSKLGKKIPWLSVRRPNHQNQSL